MCICINSQEELNSIIVKLVDDNKWGNIVNDLSTTNEKI